MKTVVEFSCFVFVLLLEQEKFCGRGCVDRFLTSKGDNVKKAAKQLRACLSWRESIGIGMVPHPMFII